MNPTWDEAVPPARPKITALGWVRVLVRVLLLVPLVFGGLLVLLVLRLIERPVFGLRRPWTPHITQFVCRGALRIMGLPLQVAGHPMKQDGAMVANHSSWIDIFALNASDQLYFVSKAEVAGWAGIGWLARATGTVFIERNRSQARAHAQMMQERLLAGHKLLFFPEGTSTDGLQVLTFKTTLFQAFMSDALRDKIWVQPVCVAYQAPAGMDARQYGWWGGMSFGPHLIDILALPRQGAVHVTYLAPLEVAQFQDRKALALECEKAVRQAHEGILKG